MVTTPNINTLVDDINNMLSGLAEGKALDISEDKLKKFTTNVGEVFLHWATPQEKPNEGLRMSNIGKPNRQVWFDYHDKNERTLISPNVMLKFLYGHLLEEVLLFLTELAGHKVEEQQVEVSVDGIKGHIDAIIDDVVVDVKTASQFAFKKFKNGTLINDDPFGYLAQLSGYQEALGKTGGGFLVVDKSSGELCFHQPEEMEYPNVKYKIKTLREVLKQEKPPKELCYAPVSDGKGGNMSVAKGCIWCHHKWDCHENLRAFKYASGIKYLTKVVKTPKVEEVYV